MQQPAVAHRDARPFGEENMFLATETISEAGNAAPRAAKDWLAESSTQAGGWVSDQTAPTHPR